MTASTRQASLWASAVLLAAAALVACSRERTRFEASAPPDRSAGGAGKRLYVRYCALCHGKDGAGYAADNAAQLANPTFLATASTSFLWLAIEHGRPGTPMAGYGTEVGGPLSPEEVKSIIDYLRSLTPTPRIDVEDVTVAGQPERGAPVYETQCAACHGAKGEGGEAPSLRNPYFLATASDGFIRYAIEHGRPGTAMKGYRGQLSQEQIDDVTRYIRTWSSTVDLRGRPGAETPTLDDLVINPDGGHPSWEPLRDGRYVPAEEVRRALERGERMVILDARATSDWMKSHIPGAYPLPYYADEIPAQLLARLPRDGTWIVAYCACPHAASGMVIDKLRTAGFRKTAIIDEGILEWAKRGYPVTFGDSGAR
jgi:cytochrome c oxidase cbb3-type subunit 3